MATWMTHFRIAQRLIDRFGIEKIPFIVGNIAPDCGVPDGSGKNYIPPRLISHFTSENGREIYAERFRRRYMPSDDKSLLHSDPFLLGYYVHLQTDDLWARQVYLPIKEANLEQYHSNTGFIAEVKAEWYALDFDFLADNREFEAYRIFCTLSEYPNDYLDFFPPDAVTRNIAKIQRFYGSDDNRPNAAFRYFDRKALESFLDRAANVLTALLSAAPCSVSFHE